LRGIVKGFDPFTVLLEYEGKTHLVYKHAISTISPAAAVALSETGQ
jgi:host factor-I protein